jgi:hypothetical protein
VKFEYHNDSRWSIDTKAHFEYEVPKYHLWVLKPQTMEPSCRVFIIEEYVIDSTNENFIEVLSYKSKESRGGACRLGGEVWRPDTRNKT